MLADATLRRVLRSDRSVALWGDLIRATVIGTILLVLALYAVYYAVVVRLMFDELHMNDFGKFYYSTQSFLAGEDMYGPSPATAIPVGKAETRQFWNMNPPHFHILILPLTLLAPAGALLIWSLVNVAGLVASLKLAAAEAGLTWTFRKTLLTALGIVACSATGMIAITGQLTFLFLLPITLSWLAARRRHHFRAGVWLGLVASIKPFLGLFALYWLLQRRWQALFGMIAGGAGLAFAGLVIFGVRPYASWLTAIGAVEWAWVPMNGSVAGIVSRAFGENPVFVPVVVAPHYIFPIASLLSIIVGLATFGALARDQSSHAEDRSYAGLIIASLLMSPLGWFYYMPWILAPALVLAVSVRNRPSRPRTVLLWLSAPAIFVHMILIGMILTGLNDRVTWTGVSIGSIYGWATICIWLAVLCDSAAARSRSLSRVGEGTDDASSAPGAL